MLVIEKTDKRLRNHIVWKCKCDCGNDVLVTGCRLTSNHTRSCGCLLKEINRKKLTKHGKYNTRIYNIYDAMKQRCYNPRNSSYKYYGTKGIKVCDEWLNDFVSFYSWSIANGYKDNLTIDRINADEDYKPSNCRWATYKEQVENRKCNHWITYNGKTQILTQWAKEYNLTYDCLRYRIRSGWDIEKALNTPQKIRMNTKRVQ